MPIKHVFTTGVLDTDDILLQNGDSTSVPIDKVFEKGDGNPIIWERGRAPIGWYGVIYPATIAEAEQINSELVPAPTSAQFELSIRHGGTSATEITVPKQNITVRPVVNEAAWVESTGLTVDEFYDWPMGRVFLITRNWGEPEEIITNGMPTKYTFVPTSNIVIDGVEYFGYVARRFATFGPTSAFLYVFL